MRRLIGWPLHQPSGTAAEQQRRQEEQPVPSGDVPQMLGEPPY